MAGKSSYLEGVYLDWRFALGSFASADAYKDVLSVTNHYLAIFKGDPEGAGVEVSGGSYAREALGWGAANWTRTGSVVTNDNAVDFGTASADWATLGNEATHVAVFDDPTAGNMLEVTELDAPRIILNGDPVQFVAGQLQFTED